MATVHWGGGDGDWGVAANWLEGVVPQPGDDVVIDSGNPRLTAYAGAMGSVTVGAGAALTVGPGAVVGALVNHGHIDILSSQFSVTGDYVNDGTIDVRVSGTLVFNDIALAPLDLSDGITNAGRVIVGTNAMLDLGGGTFDLAAYGRFDLSNGTIANGTIVDNGSAPPLQSGTLNDIVYQGDLDIGTLTVTNGLTVLNAAGDAPGTINVSGRITFAEPAAIDNIVINWTGGTGELASPAGTTILGTGVVMNLTNVQVDGSFINQGQINATSSTFRVFGVLENQGEITVAADAIFADTDFVNNGTVDVHGIASLSGTLSGGGAITMHDGARVTLYGAAGAGQTINLVGGELRLANPAVYAATIDDFDDAADVINLANVKFDAGDTVSLLAGNVLEIFQAVEGSTIRLQLDPAGSYGGVPYQLVDDGAGGTDIVVTCFCAGTRIATPAGAKTVGRLAAGDLVLTAEGETRPVLWIGRQTVVPRFTDPLRTSPVRIAAGALAEGVPARDLHVSRDHALLIEGLLVQAGALVNGTTVTYVERPEARFTYYHIELDDHALVLAEGAPAETFVDNVSRRRFDNYAQYEARFGDSSARIPELELPRIKAARQLPQAVRARLTARASALGFVAVEAA